MDSNKHDPRTKASPVMTVAELCAYLRMHNTTVYRLIKDGKLPHFRIGSDYRFNREAIDSWIQAGGNRDD